MLTVCWAAKGGSGTTVVAATMSLATPADTLLIDLAGDVPAALGLPEPDGPGVRDWLVSDAPSERLAGLEVRAANGLRVLPAGAEHGDRPMRWSALVEHLGRQSGRVIADAGTGEPPLQLVQAADRAWLVTRACYLALRSATRQAVRPNGVVVVEEPGRALTHADIEATLGAPVVAGMLTDPAIARAVDAGLLLSHLPSGFRRQLQLVA